MDRTEGYVTTINCFDTEVAARASAYDLYSQKLVSQTSCSPVSDVVCKGTTVPVAAMKHVVSCQLKRLPREEFERQDLCIRVVHIKGSLCA